MPSNSILRGGNRLNHYDRISSFAEEGTNYSAMQRYTEPVRRFLKAVNSIDRPALANSNSYSSSASSVPSFATPTNFRTSGETEFSCTHSPVRRSEGRSEGTHNKVLSDISKEIWDYLLSKGITITVEHLPGVLNQEADLVSIKGGFNRMEAKTECFSSIVQKKVDPRHRSLCVAVVKPGPMLLFLETRPLQQGQRCIPNVMEIPKTVCFSTFQSNREGTEQGTSGPSSNFADNSSLAHSVVVSTSSTNVNRETNANTSRKGSLNGLKVGEAFTHRDRKIKTSALDNFREKLFAEEFQKTLQTLSQVPKDKVQFHITKRPGESGIAGVVGNKLIPLVAL